MGTGQAVQMAQSAIQSQGTDTVLGVFTDKVWLLIGLVVLIYLLGKAHGRLHESKSQPVNTSKYV